MATQTKKTAAKSSGKSTAPAKSGTTITKSAGAGPAIADRSKDAAKPASKPAAKKASPKAAAKPNAAAKPAAKAAAAKTASSDKKPSLVRRVARSVAATATGAVELAVSVVGIGEKKSNAKKS